MTDTSPAFNSDYTRGVYNVPEFKAETPQHVRLFHLDRLLHLAFGTASVELVATIDELRVLNEFQIQQNRMYDVVEQARRQAWDETELELPEAYKQARDAELAARRSHKLISTVTGILKALQEPNIHRCSSTQRGAFTIPASLLNEGNEHYTHFSDLSNNYQAIAKRLSHTNTVVGRRRKERASVANTLGNKLGDEAAQTVRESAGFIVAKEKANELAKLIEARRDSLTTSLSNELDRVIEKLDWQDVLNHVGLYIANATEWIVNPVPLSPISES